MSSNVTLDSIDGLAANGIARTAASTRAVRVRRHHESGDGNEWRRREPSARTAARRTTGNVRFGNLGLGVAAYVRSGQIAATLGANSTAITVKRQTDTSPTGNFLDLQNAAGSALALMNITGAATFNAITSNTSVTANTAALGSLSISGSTLSSSAGVTIISTTTSAVSLDSGTTGAVNIGTNSNAKTITLGNTTGATALNLRAGSGAVNIISGVFNLGTAGSTAGQLGLRNNTSGALNIIAPAGVALTGTVTIPNVTGNLITDVDTGTVTNTMLAGSIALSKLTGLGTGVATALAVNVGSAGAFVTNGGALGTPSSGTLTNATGLPISTGVSGLGTNVATFLGTPSSSNLAAALTDETGTGAAVFAASPTLSGTIGGNLTFGGTLIFNKATVGAPVTLTDAATVATDASAGNRFRVTLGGNRTLGNPTNPTDNQQVVWELIQDATGSRTISLDTKFTFGTDITSITLTTTAGKRDFLTAIYNSTADKWYVVGIIKGF
ncbi:MAG: hypothetical protein U0Y68_20630 [Blastocatellia bacterium]